MDANVGFNPAMADPDRRIADLFARERSRLTGFIRRQVSETADVEDIVQDVFSELVEATRLVTPIEHLGGWLFGVARHRIADLFRSRRRHAERVPGGEAASDEDETGRSLAELIPALADGPEAAYARRVMLEAMDDALAELPAAQREVFIAHELEGRSFKALAAETGLGVNTLLSQKHYAVRHLRRRLQSIHDEFIDPN